MIPPPPISTLFPYTTLFRSHRQSLARRQRPAARRGMREAFHHRPCRDRKSTRLNSSHQIISYAVFCLKKKKITVHVQQNLNCQSFLKEELVLSTIGRVPPSI